MTWRAPLLAGLVFAPGVACAQQSGARELATLHDDLRLTAKQEAAWQIYAQAIAPSADVLARHRSAGELMPLIPTPRRIALIEANMAQDAADFRRKGAAVIAFYQQLTPDQQRTFDRESLSQPESASPQSPGRTRPPAAR
jgi:hypothetical protein